MQENKSMIESVRDYFLECPILKDGHLYIDYLNEKPTDYSIDPLVCSPIVKKYSDGGSLRRYQFAFMSSEVYSQSEIENMQNSGFYERLAEWIETQNKINNLPALQDVEVQSIEVLSPGCLFDAEGTVARYQIQMEIQYLKEA